MVASPEVHGEIVSNHGVSGFDTPPR
jgi:hypothetical protein